MSQAILDKLTAERQEITDYVTRTLDQVEGGRDLNEAELRTVTDAKARIEGIDAQIKPLAEFMQSRAAAIDVSQLLARGEHAHTQTRATNTRPQVPQLSSFVDSPEFRAFREGGGKSSGRFTVEGFQARAPQHILDTTTEPGVSLMPTPQRIVLSEPETPRPLLAAVGHIPVTTNAVDMIFWGSPDGAKTFAKVPEKNAKPEVTLEANSLPVVLGTIAGWVAVTRQLLEDAPAARGMIDGQLRRGYYTALEKEAAAVIGSQTFTKVTGAAGQSLLQVARLAQAELQATGYTPDVMLASPADAAAMDLALMEATLLGAVAGTRPWGLQVIPVTGLTKSYVGDVRTAVSWLEKMGVQIYITDSHEDLFIKNVFVILAEGRSAFAVTQPAAVRELAVTAAP